MEIDVGKSMMKSGLKKSVCDFWAAKAPIESLGLWPVVLATETIIGISEGKEDVTVGLNLKISLLLR